MKCIEYLEKIIKRFEKTGDNFTYDNDLGNMRYFCEDYDDYIESLRKKNQN